MLTREHVAAQLVAYVNSFSAENNFLGCETLLDSIKVNYRQLSSEDQAHVKKQYQTMSDAALSPQQKKAMNESQKDLVKGAAIGAIGGAIGGAVLGNNMSSGGSFLKTVLSTGGGSVAGGVICGFGGAFFGSSIKLSSTELRDLTRKIRPFSRLREALELNILLKSTQYLGEKTEGSIDALRQRRGARR